MHHLDIPSSLTNLRRLAKRFAGAPEDIDRPPKEVLFPEFLASLRRLDLRAKLLVRGFLQGLHRTPRRGFSAEFSDHRTFVQGDDVRFIDWRLYARTDRLFVKCFEAETAQRATIVMDASASMGYRSKSTAELVGPVFTKLGYSVTLAAALVYLLQSQRDRVGLFCAGGKDGGFYLPPRSPRAHMRRVIESLSAVRAAGDTDIVGALESLASHDRRRGMIILFSDGLCGRQRLLNAMRHLKHRGHDLIFFQIWDPAELNPPIEPGMAFRDPETQARFEPLPPEVYRQRAEDHLQAIRDGCLSLPCDYQFLTTETPFDRALIRFLRLRRKRV
jgi:uncharacterized protein (DUF58 family)